MQQRQLRLGDILDDYCPRERRVTNHAVVAMIGSDVKQTRCTTCDAEHEYKHAKVPRQRRKTETPAALYSQILANGPKRVAHEGGAPNGPETSSDRHVEAPVETSEEAVVVDVKPAETQSASNAAEPSMEGGGERGPGSEPGERGPRSEINERDDTRDEEEGPVHRPLIRASLPRPNGQQPPARPIPEFTIRQPGGRQNRFRPRHQRGGQQGPHGHQFQGGSRSNGPLGGPRGNPRPPHGPHGSHGSMPSRLGRRHGPGRHKRSK